MIELSRLLASGPGSRGKVGMESLSKVREMGSGGWGECESRAPAATSCSVVGPHRQADLSDLV
jgi:hypothetical protein